MASTTIRDPFVKARLSSPSSYRSRAAYKLIELNDKWGRFLSRPSVRSVVDLGAAPGGWSQAADNAEDFGLREETKVQKRGSWSTVPVNKTTGRGKIVALDLLPMMPIPGVQTLQMDFLAPGSACIVRDALKSSRNPEGTADIQNSDSQMSLDICHAVFDFAKGALTHFAHPLLQEFRKEHLEPNFHLVHYIKPDSSRADSAEGYWLCRGWLGRPNRPRKQQAAVNILRKSYTI
ncbi:ribosomal RNA methyltransferase FtsJ domain-containing protein [Suillus spraguei]|nr:ribosomal RNA methyltransferase FtsJ domain-containing protein [Suillus spraguei]